MQIEEDIQDARGKRRKTWKIQNLSEASIYKLTI
jgi:hypothetical protein